MKRTYLALLLVLLFCLPLAACQGSGAEATGTWQEIEDPAFSLQEIVGAADRSVPFDETAFEEAKDRRGLSDEATMALEKATDMTVETATVDGTAVVRAAGGNSDVRTAITPDGTTLITRGLYLDSLWITTAEGSLRLDDAEPYGGEVKIQPDGQSFAYGVSSSDGSGTMQVWLYDLATHEKTVIPTDKAFSYNLIGWLAPDVLLCSKSQGLEDGVLVTLDLAGNETILDAPAIDSMTTWVDNREDLILTTRRTETVIDGGLQVDRYTGQAKLTPVYQCQDGVINGLQTEFFSPDRTKLAMAWAEEVPSVQWNVRVVDLETAGVLDMTPPAWETEASILFVRWEDNGTLLVTALEDLAPESQMAAWHCTLPEIIGGN